MNTRSRLNVEALTQLALVLLLVIGCWLVLRPFFPAILFAIVVAVSTWPAYAWLLARLRYRSAIASAIACTATVLLALAPATLLVMSLADGVGWLVQTANQWFKSGALPPEWLQHLPVFGDQLQAWWLQAIDNGGHRLAELLGTFADPARRMAITSGRALGNAALQLVLVILLVYFLYRNGTRLGAAVTAAADRVAGPFGHELLDTARRTIVAVMFSIVGAGLAQSMVATLGFAIAGVPNPFLLGALTFILSLIAFGPPLLWAGASIWLFRNDEPAWGVFMLVYGALAISSIDNLLKPLIISRANRLSFVLTLMGVIGGIFAFGIMGVFLGPALLALAINLTAHWLEHAPGHDGPPEPTQAPDG
ncbi:MAG: AI-2E family transporter [Nevskiales bacterium]|nr:AI-2E family transporter [Nevskiales bacterium]